MRQSSIAAASISILVQLCTLWSMMCMRTAESLFLVMPITTKPLPHHRSSTVLFSSQRDDSSSSDSNDLTTDDTSDPYPQGINDRTTFDQAGRSLMDEQDNKRLEAMGDFDVNPDSSAAQMEKMRQAIRERTASMGLEKSKVSADYIAQRQQQALSMGSAKAASESADVFGGLDLSQISSTRVPSPSATRNGLWAEEDEMPSMFYEPENELSEEERAEIDPVGKQSFLEQGLNEFRNTKWPTPGAALKEVVIMLFVVAITGALILGWDRLIRGLYTDVLHFIPSKTDLANYMNRFDGLDLPKGWTDNMNESDIASFSDKVSSNLPDL